MRLPADADGNFIEVPFVATARRSPPAAIGEFSAEFKASLPDRLVCHRDAAGGQHLLHHVQAQRKPKYSHTVLETTITRLVGLIGAILLEQTTNGWCSGPAT